MNDYVPFVVSGLVVGSIYSIAAMGLVLTYRTTGLFNFAHGAVGMSVAFAFYQMRSEWGVPTPVAAGVAVLVVAPIIGILVDRFLFRRLDQASQAAKIVVTVGLLILLQGMVTLLFGAVPRPMSPFLPQGTFRIGSIYVGHDQAIIVGVALAVLSGLTLFLRASRTGVAMRALVDNPDLVASAGFSPRRVSGVTWAIGSMLAGLAGVLLSPLLGLDTISLTLLVVQAYASAVFGRLTSLPRTVVAALALGVASTTIIRSLQGFPTLVNGLRPSLPFLFLFAVLTFSRGGRFRALGAGTPWAGSVATSEPGWKACGALLLALALVIPDSELFPFSVTLVLACAFLSLTALTGTSGLISLTHAGLAGTGAFAYIHLVSDAGFPFPLALFLAGLVVVPFGVAIAVPALRLPSLFLALGTFALGQLIDGLLFSSWSWLSGGRDGLRVARPALLRGDQAYALFLVAAVMLFMAAVIALRRSVLGRTLVALRDSAPATVALGVNPLWPRLGIFAVSAFMAGIAGGLYAGLLEVASKDFFSTLTSLTWVTVVVIGGVESPIGALVAAFLYFYAPSLLFSVGRRPDWLVPAFGLGAILFARRPGGLVGLVRAAWPARLFGVAPAPDAPPISAPAGAR